MTKGQELKAILNRMVELLGKDHPDCVMLGATLSCRNCHTSRYMKGSWICLTYGPIPDQYLKDGCDNWKNNIGVGCAKSCNNCGGCKDK